MFAIGDRKWTGLSKLIEECGEVLQICGKLIQTRGEHKHWNIDDLKCAIEDEIADLKAAIEFVIDKCYLRREHIEARAKRKYEQFVEWHENDHVVTRREERQ